MRWLNQTQDFMTKSLSASIIIMKNKAFFVLVKEII